MLAALLSSVHAANLIRFLCEQHFTTHTFPIPTRHSLALRYDPQQLPWKSLSLPGLWWWWLWWWWCRVGGECYYYVSRDRDDKWSEEQHQDEFCALTPDDWPTSTAHVWHSYPSQHIIITIIRLEPRPCLECSHVPCDLGEPCELACRDMVFWCWLGRIRSRQRRNIFLGLQRCLNLKPLPMAVQLLIGVRVWSGLCSCLRIPRTIAQAPY